MYHGKFSITRINVKNTIIKGDRARGDKYSQGPEGAKARETLQGYLAPLLLIGTVEKRKAQNILFLPIRHMLM